jgi:hypothetical protein
MSDPLNLDSVVAFEIEESLGITLTSRVLEMENNVRK